MPTPKQNLPNLNTLANKFTDLAPVIYMSVLRTKGGSGESRVVQELADKLSQRHHKVLIVTSQKALKYGHKVRGYDTTPNVPMEIMQILEDSMSNTSFKLGKLIPAEDIPNSEISLANTYYDWMYSDIDTLKKTIAKSHYTAVIFTTGEGSAVDGTQVRHALKHSEVTILSVASDVRESKCWADVLIKSISNSPVDNSELWSLQWKSKKEIHTYQLVCHN